MSSRAKNTEPSTKQSEQTEYTIQATDGHTFSIYLKKNATVKHAQVAIETETGQPQTRQQLLVEGAEGPLAVDLQVENATSGGIRLLYLIMTTHITSIHEGRSAFLRQNSMFENFQCVHIVQLVDHDGQLKLWRRWGRVCPGARCQCSLSGAFADELSAIKAFERLFKSKTGCSWANRESAEKKPKKYTMVGYEDTIDCEEEHRRAFLNGCPHAKAEAERCPYKFLKD
jgi:predicted DNA-binding WGR domain protein